LSPFGTDLPFDLLYNTLGTHAYPKERSHGIHRSLLSLPARQEEVMSMCMTWDTFFAFCMFVVSVISLIVEVFNEQ
jgi:hypothetical protein